MASSFSALFRRLICPKGIAAGSGASLFHRRGVLTAAQNQEDCSIAPWLMLSPGVGTPTSYKFYSLSEKKVVQTLCPDSDDVIRLTCRGSSHGWLAFLSPDNDAILLYNPISRRHIKLPSILNLPAWPHDDIDSSKRYINKIILSSSPDEEDCRVVMVRACSNPLAFCCPGRSKDWTLMLCDYDNKRRFYDDCVYSATQKLFYALTGDSIEVWSLRDPSSPRFITRFNVIKIGHHYRYYDFRPLAVDRVQHLVVAEDQQQDLLQLFVVFQYTMYCVGTDGWCFPDSPENLLGHCRYMTFGFDIYKYDPTKKRTSGLKYVDSSSLGGLALFVGLHSHSVAIPASRFPELQPNSIYFTDPTWTGRFAGYEDSDEDDDGPFGGHDIGVFNYEDKTVSPCYYPCDIGSLKKILPAPIWFFPSPPI